MSAAEPSKVPLWVTDGMLKRGWNQAELARRTGLNTNTISYLLAGKRPPNPTTLQLIAQAFEADPEGTALAVGSTAARGAVEKMIHENKYFADLYLAFKDLSPEDQRRASRFVVKMRLKSVARESETTEGDA